MREHTTKYRADNFVCPHCKISSQQRWFEASTASNAVNKIIHNLYLEYRSGIAPSSQRDISKFLRHVYSGTKNKIYNYIPKGFSIASCTHCREISL